MHRLESDRPGSFVVSCKRDFIRNGILTQKNVSECFDFAFGMTFGKQGAHRDHSSGGQAHRRMGEIFINTFQGKLAEFALYNYVVHVEEIMIDPPDMEMMDLSRWNSFDMDIEGFMVSVKSTKKRGNLLLLETKDWDSDGRYIPNSKSGCELYDYFVLARVDPDGEGILRLADGTKFKGSFKNGEKNGAGILVNADGERYEGGFLNNEKDGAYVLKDKNGNIIEKGTYVRGIKRN